jgi:hypothetical protein
VVGLSAYHRGIAHNRMLLDPLIDLGQRQPTIDGRFASTQEVQVRPVQDEDGARPGCH